MSLWLGRRNVAAKETRAGAPALAAWVLLTALCQAELAGFGGPGLRRPDLPLALAVAFAFGLPRRKALVWAALAGIAQDLLSCCPLGWNATLNLAAAAIVVTVRSRVFADSPVAQALLGGAAGLGKGLAGWMAARVAGGGPTFAQAFWAVLGGALACAVLTPVFVWITGGNLRLAARVPAEERAD